jgi:ribosomal protein L11 methyltransferase
MKKKHFFVDKIFTQPFNPELISGLLWEFDLAGLIEEENHLKIFTSEDSDISLEAIKSALDNLRKEKLIESFSVKRELLEDKNWNELWEKSREVIRVSDSIVIKPTFKEYFAKENEIVLTIDPKMSFGTGEHQTTRLVLRLLEKYVKPGMKILDVGSGTGILAIAAIKLGASKAVAIDFDEICYNNCRENCVLNGVSDAVEVLTGEIDDVKGKDFDMILANIQKNVLLEIAKKIKERISKNGIVILCGLLESDKIDIENKYQSLGFKTERVESMDEWIALIFSEF